MRFKFLGTAAAERVPAVFCNCEICNKVRDLGEKNIRTCSQAIIDEDLLLDLCPDTYPHLVKYNLRLDKVKYLLITHSHGDHFSRYELEMRGVAFAHDLQVPDLQIYCNKEVAAIWAREGMYDRVRAHQRVEIVEPFRAFGAGEYEITPLPARHTAPEQSLFYMIQKEGKTLLYAHDTGYFFDEVFDYFAQKNIVFDFVSLDCTDGFLLLSESAMHMALNVNEKLLQRLRKLGAVVPHTQVYLNHFSHNGKPIHADLEKAAAKFGAKPAYDGLELTL